MCGAGLREKRELREELDRNLLYLVSNTTQSANDLLVQAILEMEQGLPGGTVDLYALMPDCKTFAQCATVNVTQ